MIRSNITETNKTVLANRTAARRKGMRLSVSWHDDVVWLSRCALWRSWSV